MAAGANITRLNHTLQQLIAQFSSTLQVGKSQGKYPKQRILIVYTNCWYRTTQKTLIYHVYSTQKQPIICTGVV